jgi:hypothetical protein
MAKLTREQRNLISGQFIVNKKFRTAFLKNPKKAAETLGIDLTDAQVDEIKTYKKVWESTAKKADKALRTNLTGGLIPVYVMD